MMRRLAGFGLLVLVTGCSGATPAAGPGTLPPVATAVAPPTSAPASPTVAPVEKPALADEASEAGAEAFARYWMAELNGAYRTVDPSRLRAISQRGCGTCKAYIESLRKARSEGRSYRGGEARVASAIAAPGATRGTALVLVDHDVADLAVLDPEGQVLRIVKGEKGATLSFDLKYDGERWLARQVSPS